MPLRRRFAAPLILVVVAFGVVAPARADVITQMQSIPLTQTDFSLPLTFDKFDTSLGTLDAVCIFFTGGVQSQLSATNTAESNNDITVEVDTTFSLLRPDNSDLFTPFVVDVSEMQNLAPGGSFDVMRSDTGNAVAMSPPPFSDLALFSGAGSINLIAEAMAMSSGTDTQGGNFEFDTLTSASVDVTLEYKFTPAGEEVPEPSTLALLGGGLTFAMGSWLRRKVKNGSR
jgi:hypothetical protein